MWASVQEQLFAPREEITGVYEPAYGSPLLVTPRLGQAAFRISVTDAYGRSCAVTGERALPTLQAAHIKPFSMVGKHEVRNGLLLRSDIHNLFDAGYVSVDPDLRFRVSPALGSEFANGRAYYELNGSKIRDTVTRSARPSKEFLEWHYSTVFKP